jgi:hypothetical protein
MSIQERVDELCRLRDENADLRQDAERYRWLRDQDFSGPLSQVLLVYQGPTSDRSLRPAELDAAIDAQMKTKVWD